MESPQQIRRPRSPTGRLVHYECTECGFIGSVIFDEHDDHASLKAIQTMEVEHCECHPECSAFGFQLVLENGLPM